MNDALGERRRYDALGALMDHHYGAASTHEEANCPSPAPKICFSRRNLALEMRKALAQPFDVFLLKLTLASSEQLPTALGQEFADIGVASVPSLKYRLLFHCG
jgi:hypothetical protein